MSKVATYLSAFLVGGLLMLTMLIWCNDARGPNDAGHRGKITIGKETTYATEPIDAKGYVDYVAALNERLSKGVTPENNANVLLWKAFGPHPENSTMCPEFFKAMGIESPPEKGDYFRDLNRYLKEDLKLEPLTEKNLDSHNQFMESIDASTQRPWSAKDFPNIATWLKVNEKPLAVVAEAVKREQFYNPLIPQSRGQVTLGLIGALLPAVQKCRELAITLSARALLRAAEGNTDGAWQDLLTCHRLGRLVGRGGCLIEGLVGIAIDRVADKADLAFLERTKPNAKQIEGYLSDLRKLPPMPDVAGKVDLCERYMILEAVRLVDEQGLAYLQRLSGHSGENSGINILSELALVGIDWDPALIGMNSWMDRIVAAMNEKDAATRNKKMEMIDGEIKALKAKISNAWTLAVMPLANGKDKGQYIGDMMICLMIPALNKVQLAWDKSRQSHENMMLAFALAAFHGDNGHYPKTLSELAPKYRKEIANDSFSGKPLIYRPSDKGYLLYSVGPNGKDDNGRNETSEPTGDDIAVLMPLPALKKP